MRELAASSVYRWMRLELWIALGAALSACDRHAPPAPVYLCKGYEEAVMIDGRFQRALVTQCRDDRGQWALHGNDAGAP